MAQLLKNSHSRIRESDIERDYGVDADAVYDFFDMQCEWGIKDYNKIPSLEKLLAAAAEEWPEVPQEAYFKYAVISREVMAEHFGVPLEESIKRFPMKSLKEAFDGLDTIITDALASLRAAQDDPEQDVFDTYKALEEDYGMLHGAWDWKGAAQADRWYNLFEKHGYHIIDDPLFEGSDLIAYLAFPRPGATPPSKEEIDLANSDGDWDDKEFGEELHEATHMKEYELYVDENGDVWNDEGERISRGRGFGKRFGGQTYGTHAPFDPDARLHTDTSGEQYITYDRDKVHESKKKNVKPYLKAMQEAISPKTDAIAFAVILLVDEEGWDEKDAFDAVEDLDTDGQLETWLEENGNDITATARFIVDTIITDQIKDGSNGLEESAPTLKTAVGSGALREPKSGSEEGMEARAPAILHKAPTARAKAPVTSTGTQAYIKESFAGKPRVVAEDDEPFDSDEVNARIEEGMAMLDEGKTLDEVLDMVLNPPEETGLMPFDSDSPEALEIAQALTGYANGEDEDRQDGFGDSDEFEESPSA
jgi:hypothetical protein